MSATSTATGFPTGSVQHVALIGLTVVGSAVALWWGRRHRHDVHEVVVRRSAAVALLAITLALQAYMLTPARWSPGSSLPLDLSDLADYAAVIALWTRGERSTGFTYDVGLTLTLMAIVTPALGQTFPDPRWFGFWLRHIGVVWAAVYLVWGLGFRPTWRTWRATVVITLIWFALVLVLDHVTGTNYGFLQRRPSTASALDLLGPWPWYLVATMTLLFSVWALVMTWPWEADRARRRRIETGAETTVAGTAPPHVTGKGDAGGPALP